MKKSTFLFSVAFLGAAIACQKEENITVEDSPKLIQKTVTLADDTWADETSSKSLYEPGVGVHLTKWENMSVYYWKHIDDSKMPTEANRFYELIGSDNKNRIGAEAKEAGRWSFSHPEIDEATAYNYFFVIPHTSQNAPNSKGTGHSFRLFPLQFPENLKNFPGYNNEPVSFDPMMDCHIGQAQYNVSKAEEIRDIHFKRVFVPLKLVITDSKGILKDEEKDADVYAVTLKSAAKSKKPIQMMTGIAYFNHSDVFANAKINSIGAGTGGNGVTTIYRDPLKKEGETYTTWYIVNPTDLGAADLTVSVTTAKKTVTRTISNVALSIKPNIINTLTVDISKDNCTTETTDYYNFCSDNGKLNSIAGSFGGAKPWTQNSVSPNVDFTNSKYCYALRSDKDGALLNYNISKNPGKAVSNIRIYGHPRVSTGTEKATIKFNLKSGDNIISENDAPYSAYAQNGGYIDITVPDEYKTSDLQLAFTSGYTFISAIRLTYVEDEQKTE